MRLSPLAALCLAACTAAPNLQSPPPFDPTPWIGPPPARPFPQPVDLDPGALRPSRAQNDLDADVRAAYARWAGRYVVLAPPRPDGSPRMRVRTDTTARADTVSEGQGYGMLLTAWMAGADPYAKVRFDALWRYAADHRSDLDPRLMDWHVPANERAEPGQDDAAFDGDADIALGLLLADAQWGSGGEIDYAAHAALVIAGLTERALGPTTHLPLLGDWVNPQGAVYNEHTTRTSDFLPEHFVRFADHDPQWDDAVDAVLTLSEDLQARHAPATGLLPDFVVPAGATFAPAPPGFLEGPHDGHWSYNAVRVPWRLGQAAARGDTRARDVVRRLTPWARTTTSGDPRRLASTYTLDGRTVAGYRWTSVLFQSTVMVAMMSDPQGQTWLDAAWASVAQAHEGYYEDSVALLAMLAVDGRSWLP